MAHCDLRSASSSSDDDVYLGPSANPHARPTDFDFLAVIGKGTFGKVALKHCFKYINNLHSFSHFGLCKEGVEPEGTTSTFCGTPEVSDVGGLM
ncbi:hypothetical protein XENOCAPTIV_001689 [Xenoophorus captivus]|uniref:Uncharacterized protein n=1 Tax=Xenoophorus captivus TaxID=1517983 RepID=A0ABV0QUM4_9TELE